MAAALQLSACSAGNAYVSQDSDLSDELSNSLDASDDTNSADSGDDSDEDSSVRIGTAPLITERVGTVGYNSVTLKVNTRKELKMIFTPETQDESVEDGNFSPSYSKLAVFIKVGSLEQPTPLLNNGLNGATVQHSRIFDFSSYIPKTCAEDDDTCQEEVTITVGRPNYDYGCLNFPFDSRFCFSPGYSKVYETHPWHGTLAIQTDDTITLQEGVQ